MEKKFIPSITYHFYFGTGFYKLFQTPDTFVIENIKDGSEESISRLHAEITRRVEQGESINKIVTEFPTRYPVTTI